MADERSAGLRSGSMDEAVPTAPTNTEMESVAAEPAGSAEKSPRLSAESEKKCGRRIVLLTPYSGGNLGDAAIQDTLIENIRRQFPDAEISGLTLNTENFTERHGEQGFPLCANSRPFYAMAGDSVGPTDRSGLSGLVNTLRAIVREFRHGVRGYGFLRGKSALIVAGGGQLDEEWGGAWGHPFSLYKWGMLAKWAGVPYCMVSVGAGRVDSQRARSWIARALESAEYRSFRDQNSRQIASSMYAASADDPVVPDVALGLSAEEIEADPEIIRRAAGRPVTVISPIVYDDPERWPSGDKRRYARYVAELCALVTALLERGTFVVLAWSASADQSAIAKVLERMDRRALAKAADRLYVPKIDGWRRLLNALKAADVVIASRLHSVIFSAVAKKPTIAISFDPKVDWLMEDLGQTQYLLRIRDFKAGEVLEKVERLQQEREAVMAQMEGYQRAISPAFAKQYDAVGRVIEGRERA